MARHGHPLNYHLRDSIAQLAARLMAEGTEDFALAKRKAARQLGASETQNLPNNSEIEQALRVHLALYQGDAQVSTLHQLRSQALRVMRELEAFNPLLTGPVLRGTASVYTDIDLVLFADSQKDVEHWLLNRRLPYKTAEKRFRFRERVRLVPTLVMGFDGEADVQLAILSPSDCRSMPLSPLDGKVLQGARQVDVEALVAAGAE